MEPTSTPQPVVERVAETSPRAPVYAGFWLRFVALLIDSIILSVASGIINGLTSFTVYSHGHVVAHHGSGFSLITVWLYYALMESSVWQATLGKKLMNIKVTDLDGNRIGFGRATGRYFAKFISAIILCIGFIMAAFTEKKQALHDMIAKTLVVRVK